MITTYEFPVLCDIIEMRHLEKATGLLNSIHGIWLLFFVPFSGIQQYLKSFMFLICDI